MWDGVCICVGLADFASEVLRGREIRKPGRGSAAQL